MPLVIDLDHAQEAVGESTTWYAGTIKVGDQERTIDGDTDRNSDGWVDFVAEEVQKQLGFTASDDWELLNKLNGELFFGEKYNAELVEGELVLTKIED